MKTNYVVGFLFNHTWSENIQVALIKKEKPDWQRGKLNGIGGKIEPGETPADAMHREFKEETGAEIPANIWYQFARLTLRDAVVYFFCAYGYRDIKTTTSEEVGWYSVNRLSELKLIPSLHWLIPLAMDESTPRIDIYDNLKDETYRR